MRRSRFRLRALIAGSVPTACRSSPPPAPHPHADTGAESVLVSCIVIPPGDGATSAPRSFRAPLSKRSRHGVRAGGLHAVVAATLVVYVTASTRFETATQVILH